MASLRDKVAIITGASSGIGAGIAKHFATLGAKLLLTGRNTQRLEKVASECEQHGLAKFNIHLVMADLATDDGIESVIKKTVEYFGQIDVLVNNAAMLDITPFEVTTKEKRDELLATNVTAPYYLIQLAVPELRKTKGNVVSISSIGAINPYDLHSTYCMSKAGLDHMTRCAALEFGKDGIRANTVNSGFIPTGIHIRGGMSEEVFEQFSRGVPSLQPLNRMGTPEDVAKAVAFLASDDASFITGANLSVDAGLMLMSTALPFE